MKATRKYERLESITFELDRVETIEAIKEHVIKHGKGLFDHDKLVNTNTSFARWYVEVSESTGGAIARLTLKSVNGDEREVIVEKDLDKPESERRGDE